VILWHFEGLKLRAYVVHTLPLFAGLAALDDELDATKKLRAHRRRGRVSVYPGARPLRIMGQSIQQRFSRRDSLSSGTRETVDVYNLLKLPPLSYRSRLKYE
jgi:hypothetical protein